MSSNGYIDSTEGASRLSAFGPTRQLRTFPPPEQERFARSVRRLRRVASDASPTMRLAARPAVTYIRWRFDFS